jgi:hypothetical protein
MDTDFIRIPLYHKGIRRDLPRVTTLRPRGRWPKRRIQFAPYNKSIFLLHTRALAQTLGIKQCPRRRVS